MMLGSKNHTAGNTIRWTVRYGNWLTNCNISQIDVQSSSATCTVGNIEILGPDIVFFLSGGELNERLTVALTMTDERGNTKNDSIAFTVVAP